MTVRRVSARTMASPISHAWCARNVQAEPDVEDREARCRRRPLAGDCAWRCPGGAAAARRGPGAAPGSRSTPGRARSRSAPETVGASQATARVATASGAESVRRRLSIIFQRPIAGRDRRASRRCASRARPRIHGRSCQSPRAQRCWRARGLQVVGRELVEQLDVRDQAGPGEDAFEQVVAQERVLGDAVGHRRLEGIDVVDPLAGVAALRRTGPGRRRRRPRRTGRSRPRPSRRAGRSSPRARPGAST